MKRLLALWLVLMMGVLFAGCAPEREEQYSAKPVLYLYPKEQTEVRVKLDYDGELISTWPKSDGSWTVLAQPDGTLTDEAGETYSYLFWEGKDNIAYDFSRGFVVKGEETGEFLRRTLSAMGLTPREYNEFIVYWLPQMEGNPYNLLAFQQEAYTAHAALTIKPEPDSILRVFLAWQPLKEFREIEPQDIAPFSREGFTVVEWGGAKVEEK